MDMLLAKPLAAGETATLEYSTSFQYPKRRRPSSAAWCSTSSRTWTYASSFIPDKLPRQVVWAVWDGLDGPIVERESVTLDSQFAVHRYLRFAEKTTVGFHWDW